MGNKHDAKALLLSVTEEFEEVGWRDRKDARRGKNLSRNVLKESPTVQVCSDEIGIVFVTPDVAIYKHYPGNDRQA